MIKIKQRRRARFHAIQALYQNILAKTSWNNLKLQFYEQNAHRHVVEWNYFYYLLDGIKQCRNEIDKKINQLAINKIKSINPINLSILRLSTYELINAKIIPHQIIISEYTGHAKCFGSTEGYKFVNGILENLAYNIRVDNNKKFDNEKNSII